MSVNVYVNASLRLLVFTGTVVKAGSPFLCLSTSRCLKYVCCNYSVSDMNSQKVNLRKYTYYEL